MSWSFNIGNIAGTAVRIHITFLLFLVWIFLASYSAEGSEAAVTSSVFLILLFACVLAHEFGHIFVARAFGVATPDVTLLPIGGLARLERIPEEPYQELLIAIAGPLVNVVIAGVLVVGRGRARRYQCAARGREHAGLDARPARRREPVPRGVQHDPGLPDGRRARAARAARDQARLRARDRRRRLDRPGGGVRARLHRAVLQSDADLHRDLRLSRGGIRVACGRDADGLAGRAGQHRDDDAIRDAHARCAGRGSGAGAAAHQPERVSGGRRRRQAGRTAGARRPVPRAEGARTGRARRRRDVAGAADGEPSPLSRRRVSPPAGEIGAGRRGGRRHGPAGRPGHVGDHRRDDDAATRRCPRA